MGFVAFDPCARKKRKGAARCNDVECNFGGSSGLQATESSKLIRRPLGPGLNARQLRPSSLPVMDTNRYAGHFFKVLIPTRFQVILKSLYIPGILSSDLSRHP